MPKIFIGGGGDYPFFPEGCAFFRCPGCGAIHGLDLAQWTWNGDLQSPSFSPSFVVNESEAGPRCGGAIMDGIIHFRPDCGHGMAGEAVKLVDVGAAPGASCE